MVDKVLRWYIDGNITRAKTEVGGVHTLEKDYRPLYARLKVRIIGKGNTPMRIDINDDGTSIFDSTPAITQNQTDHKWTTMPSNTLREGSIITCDIDQVFDQDTARDLTVELGLEEA